MPREQLGRRQPGRGLLGGYLRQRERALGLSRRSVLSAAHDLEVPIYSFLSDTRIKVG